MQNIPQHVAIIMDGNRRWACKKGLPEGAGHREGAKTLEEIIQAAQDSGVKILTLYAFSTENWKRPKKEIDILMYLLGHYLDKEYKKLIQNGIRLSTIGRISAFPKSLYEKIERVKKLTKNNSKLILNLALNYGAKDEIIDAVRRISNDVAAHKIKVNEITEKTFSDYLYTKDLPDPDMIIRTSGESRLSNFLLWQGSYSEIYVTKTLWPDFKKDDFKKAILAYAKRERRMGT